MPAVCIAYSSGILLWLTVPVRAGELEICFFTRNDFDSTWLITDGDCSSSRPVGFASWKGQEEIGWELENVNQKRA